MGSLAQGEEFIVESQQLGQKVCEACLCLAPFVLFCGFPPGVPVQFSCGAALLTVYQRKQIQQAYGLKPDDRFTMFKEAFLCYPCALWKHLMFLHEAHSHVKKRTEC